LMLFCSLAQGLVALSFLKNIYRKTSVSLYACFPVLFLSRYHRVKERADFRPPVLFTPGLRRRHLSIFSIFVSLSPRPLGSGAQR